MHFADHRAELHTTIAEDLVQPIDLAPAPLVKFLLSIPTPRNIMLVTEKGQVTIPKHIRQAAGVAPGSEVSFSLEGSKIVITPVGSAVKGDRRTKLRAAAARVRRSMNTEFQQFGADEIMNFLRGDDLTSTTNARRGRR